MYQLMCGKFEELDVAQLPRIDMVFADPPDNLGVQYENCTDKWSISNYHDLLDTWLQKCCTITTGPVLFSFNEKWITNVELIILKRNIQLIQRCYWMYTFGQHQKKKYTSCLRPIYWLNAPIFYPNAIKIPSARQVKYNDSRAKDGGKTPDNVFCFSRICGTFREKRKWHQNQHPEALIRQLILAHSAPGQTVFDPFIGSGTTAYVALENQRNVIGMDCSQFYLTKIEAEIKSRITKEN